MKPIRGAEGKWYVLRSNRSTDVALRMETDIKGLPMVRCELDLEAPPSPERQAELAALAALPDEEIDTSDIPPLTDTFWRNAVRNPFLKK